MSDECSLSAKRIAYFMTGLNLITGLVNLIMGAYKFDSVQIAGGIISLAAGGILLTGIIKESPKFLLIYLIIETVLFALGTICGLLLMIVLVTVSSQVVESPRDVQLGRTFVVDKYMAGLIAFVVLVVIIISWIVHFLIYVFYDDVAARGREAAQRGESTVVRYDTIVEVTDGSNGESGVVFVHKS